MVSQLILGDEDVCQSLALHSLVECCFQGGSEGSAFQTPELCFKHIYAVWGLPIACRDSLPPWWTLWLPGDVKIFQGAGTGVWFPLPCGTLLNSWPFLVAWLSRVTDANNFFHLFLQSEEGMWNPCGGCYWIDAYSMVVCDFRKQDLTFTIPWHSLSLHTPQTIWCIE